jgi:hypothetical protein
MTTVVSESVISDLFYKWQCKTRSGAQKLRNAGQLKPLNNEEAGVWELVVVSVHRRRVIAYK